MTTKKIKILKFIQNFKKFLVICLKIIAIFSPKLKKYCDKKIKVYNQYVATLDTLEYIKKENKKKLKDALTFEN